MNPPNLRPEAIEIEQDLINYRRHIHQYPELKYEEIETAKFITETLNKNTKNLQIIQKVGQTGVVAILKGSQATEDSPCILIRADMDALPLTEDSGEPFSSKIKGKHHACGHDGHVAMVLGAAIIADKWQQKLKGTIKFCFQPAEEGGAGAKAMIQDPNYPVLQNPNVDMCFGLHLNNSQYYPKVQTTSGPITASSDRVQIKIQGKGGHAMCPDLTTDAMLIGCMLVQALYTISSRNLSPTNKHTISFGKIESGTSANIIPSQCFIEGTIRTEYEQDRQTVFKRMKEIIQGFELSYQCKIQFDIVMGYPSILNNEKITQILNKSAQKIQEPHPATFCMAAEDFSFFSLERPSSYFNLGSAPEGSIKDNGQTPTIDAHSNKFTFDEKVLPLGTSIWIQLIEDLLIA